MTVEIDTFLVALYTVVDDLYQATAAAHKPVRRGAPAMMSDSEVLTLCILGQWRGNSERDLLRYAAQHWRSYFPCLLDQSAFNRRARDLAGVLTALVPAVAQALGAALAPYEVLDGVPVPLARRGRGQHHRLFAEEAGIGRGGTDRDWYYGVEALLAVSADGLVTGFVLGNPRTDDRWLADALLTWRADPTATPLTPADLPPSHRAGGGRAGPVGPIWPRGAVGAPATGEYVSDGGFTGPVWQGHWRADCRAVVLTPRDVACQRHHPARCQFARWRQVIERVNDHLEHRFHLWFPQAKTRWGLLTRIAAKLLAHNLAIQLNRLFDRPAFAATTLFSG